MKNSIDVSLPQSRTVRGYEIKRMPIGQFLRAARLLGEAPEIVAGALFPEKGGEDVLELLRHVDRSALQRLIPRALTTLPEQAVKLFAQLSGIPEAALLDDPEIGLDGLCELAEAWWEVNGLANFTLAAGALMTKARGLTTPAGSNG